MMQTSGPGQRDRSSRLRLAELVSGLGAGVLGFGLGLMLAPSLGMAAIPVIAGGIAIHGWGMFDKHRLESGAVAETWWSRAAYWVCWIILVGLIGVMLMPWLGR